MPGREASAPISPPAIGLTTIFILTVFARSPFLVGRHRSTAANPFEVTMKSPVKWLTDQQYTTLIPAERALVLAAVECDVKRVREIGGQNRGPDVEKYLSFVNVGPGSPWCAAFVSWCLAHAGWPRFKSASVAAWARWGIHSARTLKKPARGCLFYYLNADGTGHIGFVVKAALGLIYTIEGNTNDEGSREGYEVCRRIRKASAYQYIDVRV